jgi:endonuclease/exonuclease/phosphatase family metal-dependent hydrolase
VDPAVRGGRWHLTALLIGSLLVGCVPPSLSGEVPRRSEGLRVATFNVHYLDERGGGSREGGSMEGGPLEQVPAVARWEPRDQAVVAVLRAIDADLLAFQEMETFIGGHGNPRNRQQETIAAAFPRYAFTATGDPAKFPNTQPIAYRRERFEAVEQGFFFYSPTPDEIYSRPWFGRYPSFATWARFRDRQDGRFYLVFNVHIDRERYRNQIRSARLTAESVAAIRTGRDTVLVLGDYNAFRWSRIVRIVAEGADLEIAPGDGATFHFSRGLHLYPAIDHVLFERMDPRDSAATERARGPVLGLSHFRTTVYRARPDGISPSDHYPVVVDLRRE